MKPLLLTAILLTGCASESYRLGGHLPAAGRLQGNLVNVTIDATPTSYHFHADKVDNSTATRAGGSVVGTTLGGVSGIVTAAATRGLIH